MDPLSQGVVGALAAQSVTSRRHLALAAIFGGLAGMAADLDILLRSSLDPLKVLEYHRQFTHSLVFIPIGGFICAVFFWVLWTKKRDVSFRKTFLWTTLGYATHGLLDGCTSYGTQLFWPFSTVRVSFDIISIIDPLFTLPILLFIVFAARGKRRLWVNVAISWCVLYLMAGVTQHHRATEMSRQIALQRGHDIERLTVKPSFANLVVWKAVYEADDQFYALAVRPTLFNPAKSWKGQNVPKLNVERDLAWLAPNSQQAKDIARFQWFSNGYIAQDSHQPDRVVDMRYSLLPDKINGLWWIELSQTATLNEHVSFESARGGGRESAQTLWKMITE